MKTLLFAPHLPTLRPDACMKALARLGMNNSCISELTGYSKPSVAKWTTPDHPISKPALNAVNELTYRAFYAFRSRMLDGIPALSKGLAPYFRVALVQVSLNDITASMRPKSIPLNDPSDDLNAFEFFPSPQTETKEHDRATDSTSTVLTDTAEQGAVLHVDEGAPEQPVL